jgi:ferredoxin-NADP reductase
MPDFRVGTVFDWQTLSPILSTFSLRPPQGGEPFPEYKAGQYIALRRDDCRLTKREIGPDGAPHFIPVLDENGQPKRGPVTHSYSIASAPFETKEKGHLGFYVVLERDERSELGRLTESLFRHAPEDNRVLYVNRIVGDFTLDKRAQGFKSVLLVGTGTGLAPFVSMVRQLHHDAEAGRSDGVRYTLLHANRTSEELAYHRSLQEIEAARRFDFVYLPSVSRPRQPDFADPALGRGRANNLFRRIFDMPLREEQDLSEAEAKGQDPAPARAALARVVPLAVPAHLSLPRLRQRLDPAETVVLTCGNVSVMADIKYIADTNGLRFEKEDW